MLQQLNSLKDRVQSNFASDYTLSALRMLIIAWSIFIICLALVIDNKWVLGAILAYEVLP